MSEQEDADGPMPGNMGPFFFLRGGAMTSRAGSHGLTLVELVIVAAILGIGIAALIGAFVSQMALNEHARNMAWAMNDANRVMERLRQLNTDCETPSASPSSECGTGADACADWDAWLNSTTGGGKSILPSPSSNELIVVTTSGSDPLEVTVAVCWRHRSRTIGECAWDAQQSVLSADDQDGDGVVESPAMLSTLMTCRSSA